MPNMLFPAAEICASNGFPLVQRAVSQWYRLHLQLYMCGRSHGEAEVRLWGGLCASWGRLDAAAALRARRLFPPKLVCFAPCAQLVAPLSLSPVPIERLRSATAVAAIGALVPTVPPHPIRSPLIRGEHTCSGFSFYCRRYRGCCCYY